MTDELNHIDNLELAEGDELHFEDGSEWQITSFDREEDMINVRRINDPEATQVTDSWTAESVQAAFVHGDAETGDGRSTEAVKHY